MKNVLRIFPLLFLIACASQSEKDNYSETDKAAGFPLVEGTYIWPDKHHGKTELMVNSTYYTLIDQHTFGELFFLDVGHFQFYGDTVYLAVDQRLSPELDKGHLTFHNLKRIEPNHVRFKLTQEIEGNDTTLLLIEGDMVKRLRKTWPNTH